MSERMPGGIATMEARTDLALEQNRIERAIEARASSPEVSLLNDSAALEIYGSGGRTFTDPESGAVIATPERPILGKLDDISKNPKYGKTQADRDASVEEYQSDVNNLLSSGFEICQAKMVMDMRESDVEARATRTAKLIAGGLTAVEADNKAKAEYEKKDATRVRLIKEGGAFTPTDYEQVRKGESLYPATPVEEPKEEAPVEDKKEPENNPELEPKLQKELDSARKSLAALSAEMRRRTAPRTGLKEEYETALDNYDRAYREAGSRAVELLREAGLEEVDVRSLVVQGVISEKLALQKEEQDYVVKTSDKFWNRQLGKFTNYWAHSSTAKRMIIGGSVGAGAVIVTAGALTTAGVGGLVAGAAALSTRVARSLMFSKVSKDAAHINSFESKKQQDLKEVRSHIYQVAGSSDNDKLADDATRLMGDSVDRRVLQDQHQNRRRLTTAVIGIAAGAGLGLLADNVYHSPWEGNGGGSNGAENGSSGAEVEAADDSTTTTTLPDATSTPPPTEPELSGGAEVAGEVTVDVVPGGGTSHIARDQLGINFDNRAQWDAFNARTNDLFSGLKGTYFDAQSGEWRIQNPGAFQIPQSILDNMQHVADEIKSGR